VRVRLQALQPGQRGQHREEPSPARIERRESDREAGRRGDVAGRERLQRIAVGLPEGRRIGERQPGHERVRRAARAAGGGGAQARDAQLEQLRGQPCARGRHREARHDPPASRIDERGGQHDEGHRPAPRERLRELDQPPQLAGQRVPAEPQGHWHIDRRRERGQERERDGAREQVPSGAAGAARPHAWQHAARTLREAERSLTLL
jgi:hypothetical protein